MALLHATQLNPTGSFKITGSLDVYGQSVFFQTNSTQAALIVSGALELVQAQISTQIVSASLTVQGLGTFADTGSQAVVDLGEF
jgi:hypothetical protein